MKRKNDDGPKPIEKEDPFPSPPARPPKWTFKVKVENREANVPFLVAYVAQAYLREACGELKTVTSSYASNGLADVYGVGLKGVLSTQLTDEEREWQLPEPYLSEARWIRTGHEAGQDTKLELPPVVSLAYLIRGNCMTLGRAKRILRRARIAPVHGRWEWPKEQVELIRRLLHLGGES
jgi:hypothetical protein